MTPLIIALVIVGVSVLFSLIALLEYNAYKEFSEAKRGMEAIASGMQTAWKQTLTMWNDLVTEQGKIQVTSAEHSVKIEAMNLQLQALDMLVGAYGEVFHTKSLNTSILRDLVSEIGEGNKNTHPEIPGETRV